jgi:uncharacterized protein YjiS (DUF1127 family)
MLQRDMPSGIRDEAAPHWLRAEDMSEMSAQVAKHGLTYLLPGLPGQRAAAPRRARPDRLVGAVRWLAEWPRRRAVMEELSSLSDHELADIGLTRGDLPRVFDPAFAQSRKLARKAGC